MIRLMIGRDLQGRSTSRPQRAPGEAVLEIVGLRTATYPGRRRQPRGPARRDPRPCRPGRLRAHRARARRSSASTAPVGGEIRLDGKPIALALAARRHRPRASILVPEDRKRAGLLLDFPIADNISLPDLSAYRSAIACRRGRARRSNAEQQRERSTSGRSDVATLVGIAVGRQPAEGRAGQMAVDEAARA